MKQYALLLAVMTLSAGGCMGQKTLDQVLGVLGLILLMLTTVVGVRLLIRRR